MRLFVTGGDGLLGSNLVRELISRGHHITVLVQPGRKVKTLEGLEIERVEGDLLDYKSLQNACPQAEAIYHLAAMTNNWPSRNDILRKVNIEGTQNVVRLAQERQVSRLLYVGTANSFSFGTKEKPGVEDTPYLGARYGLDYMDSKYEAQQLVLEAVNTGLPAIVLNPSFMLGPYDAGPGPGKMIQAIASQKIPGYAPGGRCFINVQDAAVGLANALEKGRVGECYIIGNANLSYEEIFGKMAAELGVKAPKRALPSWLIRLYGLMASTISSITQKEPTITWAQAKISCDGHYYSADKAVRELDLPQNPIEDGIRECTHWLKTNGYL